MRRVWPVMAEGLPSARPVRVALSLVLLALLAACASHAPAPTAQYRLYDGYPAPGPPGDPWGPYIEQASARFGIPAPIIRAVMQKESRGQVRAVSAVGARGLMQVMPATYAKLRLQYGLGADPFNPRDNILAGTAYLKEMRDAVGERNMLAAYNAGPERVVAHMREGAPLPAETRAYVGHASAAGTKTASASHTNVSHAKTTHAKRKPVHHRKEDAKKPAPATTSPAQAAAGTP